MDNIEPAGSAGVSSTAMSAGAVAPSCYRVSVLSGSLEVSARLKNADDLELLIKVLEANKVLFTKTDHSSTQVLAKADRSASKPLAKVDRSETKPLAKADRSETKHFEKAPPSETEVLTLT
jgi:hypothetical protein